ncbi:hypothetical protein J1G42_03700 [Cellulomonas sp. zg-ZUI222]|uniref:Uncharacterized protein n=1 Tax=Cellulomonas wangleii TaxID=2816956 RepID=A0ABX8D3L7_9CELL|nr:MULTISPECIES: hypothetical protein [Cellulomonas]MBO0899075.1 hypothetical protein [Cellulomonas sp. zg-ZUI22]MBO0919928.1 hypothetical protein [Cellulomonas wangleii]MBO0923643.1 hypothetical protein [Cellulomonas wangleii]QVI61964.1 hypothetical protein KG103_16295 [Cellulomonas wangleii]
MRWWTSDRRPQALPWPSLLLVTGCVVLVLVCLVAAVRGRPAALAPAALAGLLALREVRRVGRTR